MPPAHETRVGAGESRSRTSAWTVIQALEPERPTGQRT